MREGGRKGGGERREREGESLKYRIHIVTTTIVLNTQLAPVA